MTGATPPMLPSSEMLEDFVHAAGKVLAVPINPEWTIGVCSNLSTALMMANFVSDFPLPDSAEPAPCYDLERD